MIGLVVLGLANMCHAASAAEPPVNPKNDAYELVKSKGCIACHGIEDMRIGPDFKSIALRYSPASQQTREFLAVKIIRGGAGSWGYVPMVAHPDMSMEESNKIVEWVLSLDKK